MGGFLRMVRAMERRCCWPPLSLIPRSPILVNIFLEKRSINSEALAMWQAIFISARVAEGRP